MRRVHHIGSQGTAKPAHSSQSISCSHMKRKRFCLNPIIQFNSLNKLYLLMENIQVIYDYFLY